MTERLYYHDSQQLDFQAEVTAVGRHDERHYTVLDRSAFYPTSGGQPFDTGTLNGVAVVDVIEREDGDVWHISEEEIAPVGKTIVGLIDKERRLRNCRNHTGQHILSAAAWRLFGMETMSVHLGDEYAAVELQTKTLTLEQVLQLESAANEVILDNAEIEVVFADADQAANLPLRKPSKREGRLRIIRIGQFDHVACGGTHCASSGGVGLVKTIGTEKIRGRVLVKYLAGRLALADYAMRFETTDQLARDFTCHPSDLVARIAKLNSEQRELRKRLSDIQGQLLPGLATELAANANEAAGVRFVFSQAPDLELPAATRLATMVANEINGLAVLVTGERLLLATGTDSGLKAGHLARGLAERCALKGGGNDRAAQLGGAEVNDLDRYREALGGLLGDD